MRYSRQRELVLHQVKSLCTHPTAEEVYEQAVKECPSLSLGTVYRNLNSLVEAGLVRRVSIPGQADRFDHTLRWHGHFYCTACGGVLLQHVASTGGYEQGEIDPEGFEHLSAFVRTVESQELLSLEAGEIARRLFWEDNPAVLEELEPKFSCRCSQKSIEAMVRNLGEKEALEIVAEQGRIEVKCEFCGKTYVLDPIDVKTLFAGISKPSNSVN